MEYEKLLFNNISPPFTNLKKKTNFSYIVVTGHKSMLKFWNIVTGYMIHEIHNAHSNFIRDIKQVSYDTLVTCSEDNAVKFWKFTTHNFSKHQTAS